MTKFWWSRQHCVDDNMFSFSLVCLVFHRRRLSKEEKEKENVKRSHPTRSTSRPHTATPKHPLSDLRVMFTFSFSPSPFLFAYQVINFPHCFNAQTYNGGGGVPVCTSNTLHCIIVSNVSLKNWACTNGIRLTSRRIPKPSRRKSLLMELPLWTELQELKVCLLPCRINFLLCFFAVSVFSPCL